MYNLLVHGTHVLCESRQGEDLICCSIGWGESPRFVRPNPRGCGGIERGDGYGDRLAVVSWQQLHQQP
jgi:hypothetical protein